MKKTFRNAVVLVAVASMGAVAGAAYVRAHQSGAPALETLMRAELAGADSTEVILSHVKLPPGLTLPLHYHPGEEIVLLLEGSAVHVEEGKPDRAMVAGERVVIPAGAIHQPRIGSDGAHIVIIYLVPKGEEVTIPAPET